MDMEKRPTFKQLEELSNNDLIRLRIMIEHVLHSRRTKRILPFVPSVSVARRWANQMTDAEITARIERLEEKCHAK